MDFFESDILMPSHREACDGDAEDSSASFSAVVVFDFIVFVVASVFDLVGGNRERGSSSPSTVRLLVLVSV